jgi:hypothetical protein
MGDALHSFSDHGKRKRWSPIHSASSQTSEHLDFHHLWISQHSLELSAHQPAQPLIGQHSDVISLCDVIKEIREIREIRREHSRTRRCSKRTFQNIYGLFLPFFEFFTEIRRNFATFQISS